MSEEKKVDYLLKIWIQHESEDQISYRLETAPEDVPHRDKLSTILQVFHGFLRLVHPMKTNEELLELIGKDFERIDSWRRGRLN